MRLHIALLSGALAVAMAVPVAADADAASSSQKVRVHVRAADRALVQLQSAVKADAGKTAASALTRNRRHMRAASRELRRLRRSTRGVRGATRLSRAAVAVGLQADTGAGVLADVVGELDGGLRGDVAGALEADLLTGADALELLTELVDGVPASAQAAMIRAISRLTQVQGVVAEIAGILTTDALSGAVRQSLASSPESHSGQSTPASNSSAGCSGSSLEAHSRWCSAPSASPYRRSRR